MIEAIFTFFDEKRKEKKTTAVFLAACFLLYQRKRSCGLSRRIKLLVPTYLKTKLNVLMFILTLSHRGGKTFLILR